MSHTGNNDRSPRAYPEVVQTMRVEQRGLPGGPPAVAAALAAPDDAEGAASISFEQLRSVLPRVLDWIQETLDTYRSQARAVAEMGFPRLPYYFLPGLLRATRVVTVDKVPVPPLGAMGLPQFADFERMVFAGITYFDTYFLRAEYAADESVHLHELIHVLQWRLLGPGTFLAIYARGPEQYGYTESPLESNSFTPSFDERSSCVIADT